MKIRTTCFALFSIALFSSTAHAATFLVSNVVDGVTDLLYSNSTSVPLSSGVATIGYFPSGFSVSTSVNISALIDNFTVAASGAIGDFCPSLGGAYAGYVESSESLPFFITFGSPLIGRPVYTFLGNGSTLADSTAFALYQSGTLLVDIPIQGFYTPQTIIGSPVIGTFGATAPITNPFNGGPTTYPTLNFVVIPEPSAALLGTIGCTVLLRRRRK